VYALTGDMSKDIQIYEELGYLTESIILNETEDKSGKFKKLNGTQTK